MDEDFHRKASRPDRRMRHIRKDRVRRSGVEEKAEAGGEKKNPYPGKTGPATRRSRTESPPASRRPKPENTNPGVKRNRSTRDRIHVRRRAVRRSGPRPGAADSIIAVSWSGLSGGGRAVADLKVPSVRWNRGTSAAMRYRIVRMPVQIYCWLSRTWRRCRWSAWRWWTWRKPGRRGPTLHAPYCRVFPPTIEVVAPNLNIELRRQHYFHLGRNVLRGPSVHSGRARH